MSRFRLLLSFPVSVLGLAFIPTGAQAAPACAADADCQPGYVCHAVSMGSCSAVACSKDAGSCPPPVCNTTEIHQCDPGAACASDSDCSPELRCVTRTTTRCSGSKPACYRGDECPPPPPPDCVTTTTSSCQARYQSICTTDAECGSGLKCTHRQVCSCGMPSSPGTPRPAVDAGTIILDTTPVPVPDEALPPATKPDADGGTSEPVPTPPPVCDCYDSESGYCDLVQRECSEASDCPQGWTCEAFATPVCAGIDGGTVDCASPDPISQCVSPFGWSVPVGSGGTGGSVGGGGSVTIDPGDPKGEYDAGAPTPTTPTRQGVGGGGAGGGSNSGQGQGHTHSGPDTILLDGGISCQLGSAPTGAVGGGWLAALGLASLLKRRSRRDR